MSHDAIQLKTARLLMRRAAMADLDAIHDIMSDEETMRYWSTLPHKSREQTSAWLQSMVRSGQGGSDEFVLEHDGRVIGKLGAWRLPEIGFFLRRELWGRGLISEALDRFVRYATAKGVPCLTADVDPLNTASLAVLNRAGFIETGRASATFTVGGRVCDSVYLRLDLPAA